MHYPTSQNRAGPRGTKRVDNIFNGAGVNAESAGHDRRIASENSLGGAPPQNGIDLTPNQACVSDSSPPTDPTSPLHQGFLSVPSHTRRRGPALKNLKIVKLYDPSYSPGGDPNNRPFAASIKSAGVYYSPARKAELERTDRNKRRALKGNKADMAMEVDGAPGSSMRPTAAGTERLPSSETASTYAPRKDNHLPEPSGSVDSNLPSTAEFSLSQRDRLTSLPSNSHIPRRTPSESSILGKRSASIMEEPGFARRDSKSSASAAFETSSQTGKPRHQAVDQVVSTVFRRESMISPMDAVDDTSSPRAGMEASPYLPSLSNRHFTQTLPLSRSPGSRGILLGPARNLSDASSSVQEGEPPPSLPGFKSLFGVVESNERPNVSRNNSSGFPDLQTLKGPLTIASTPYSSTRESRDSGTTSATTWSSRSSYGTRDSISTNITAPPSAVLLSSSLPPGVAAEGHAPCPPWSAGGLSERFHDTSLNGLGLTHAPAPSGNADLSGPFNHPPSWDLGKRPSYANFASELEQRRMSDVQEAWRRQSDNATLLSAERRRLMGSSPTAVTHRELESIKAIALHQRPAEETTGPAGKLTAADEALLAARARLLRYESYPFGSKESQDVRVAEISDPPDGRRRQSMFPPRANDAGGTNVVNLTESPDLSSGAVVSPYSPGWQDPSARRQHSSFSSQRDIQFEEIVRKASVDLAKRSANSSLTGTPVGTVRSLLLPTGMPDPASVLTQTSSIAPGTVSGAELANAREREQRQLAARTTNVGKPDMGRAISTPEVNQLPQPPSLQVAPIQHLPQSMEVDDDRRQDGLQPERKDSGYWIMGPMDADSRHRMKSRLDSPGVLVSHGNSSFSGSTNDMPREVPPSKQYPYAGPSTESHQVPSHRRPGSFHPPAGPSEAVVPYYDHPEPVSAGVPNGNGDFPSVLRKDYNPASHGARHGHPALPPDRLPPIRFAQQDEHPPAPYGIPPPVQVFGSLNPDNRMPFTSVPPPPTRTLSTPTGFSLNSTTLPGPRYTCEHCGKSFSRPSSLKIHIYSHTGEKPYKCTWPNCTRSFSVQSNLKRHAKVHFENSGQHTVSSGNQFLHMDTGSHGHGNGAVVRGSESVATPNAKSSKSYQGGFLTPQTTQPLAPGSTPEGYFDVRLHSRHHASHSPAPSALKHGTSPFLSQAGAMTNMVNAGSRIPSHLQYSVQGPQGRRVSGSSAYEDPELAEEDELDE